MASPWIVVRAGPPTASLVHHVKAGGEDALLAIVVEVWGAGDRAGAIESQLAAGIAAAFERQTTGGTTARLKAALVGADHWLQRLKAERGAAWGLGDDCGAGASVLVATAGEAILAQVGPAVAFGRAVTSAGAGGVQPSRFPSQSPWLRRDVVALSDHPLAPPLGIARPARGAHAGARSPGSSPDATAAERPLDILWANWPLGAGIGALLTRSTMAARVPRDVAERLFTASPGELKAVLASVFDADTALIVVARRGARRPATPTPDRATPRPDHTSPRPARTAPPSPTSEGFGSAPSAPSSDLPTASNLPTASRHPAASPSTTSRPAASRPTPVGVPDTDADAADTTATTSVRDVMAEAVRLLRLGLLRGARLGARVLVSLFPNRDPQGVDSYQAERTRLAAAAAVGLPVAMVGLALMMRARMMDASTTPTTAISVPGAGPDVGAAAAAARDSAAGVVRLGDIEPIANLPGLPGDARRVVAVAGVPYVLNSTLDQVDRVAGGLPAPVLSKSQPVGGAVVGALADLFWVPPVGNGPEGRVLALDEAGALWSVSGGAVAPVPRAERPPWIGVGRAAGFDGRLYVLDRSTGQIYRYAPSADGAASFAADGEDWLNPAQDLADAIDLALDGAVYVLRQDGRIAKYAGGSAVRFELAGLPTALADPQTVYASATAGRVLVADRGNGRIVVLSSEGAFQSQLMRPPQPLADPPDDGRFGLLHDVWWDEPGRRLYVVAGATLYGAGYGE